MVIIKRIRDYGIIIGKGKTGHLNKITDVKGVRVGHYTLKNETHNTGITVIMPSDDNMFLNKLMASTHVINGFGKSLGLIQIEEMGYIETPIVLTNTLNIGLMHAFITEYMLDMCRKKGVDVLSINPIVGECNDALLNDIQDMVLDKKCLYEAIEDAKKDFLEGSIGAGAGTVCCGLKGGIGSSSRIIEIAGKNYTIGVLVQSNFGGIGDLIINGDKVGEELKHKLEEVDQSGGSIMIIVATDLPISERQLNRILKRCTVGLSRTGSYIGNTSGDVVIGFTTKNRIPKNPNKTVRNVKIIDESKLDYAFRMAADATEEAILNSLITSEATNLKGKKTRYSLKELYFDK